eukprot:2946326-Amphidinium_carterae.1
MAHAVVSCTRGFNTTGKVKDRFKCSYLMRQECRQWRKLVWAELGDCMRERWGSRLLDRRG